MSLATAYGHLAAADPVLRPLVGSVGRPDPFAWQEGGHPASSDFAAMALRIVGQQDYTAAALAIFGRVWAAMGGDVTPAGLLALPEDRLRACGLSRAKASYLHDLARRQAQGAIDLENMTDVDDAAALADLTAVRGVGLWSAQLILVHQLKRPDVLPAGDIGIRRAIERAWQLDAVPGAEETSRRARPWSPLLHVRRGPAVGLALYAPPFHGEAGRSCAPNTRDHAVNRAARTGAGAAGPRQAKRPARSTGPPPPGAHFLRVPPLPQSVP
ncbi:DNA-3-methyladenine glycosylase family protein [Streptomyces sp. NPDC102405]|uniref:DNA-3-methyladenine glycosylase family protein n=1 Tax=Streptomyces sp. NPDC102405 TaxID=3366170 RepID=UPI003802EB2E